MTEESVILDFSIPEEDAPPVVPSGLIISEYNLNGVHIRTWNSVSQVAKAFNTSYSKIRQCIKGKSLQVKNRIFLKYNDSIEERLKLIEEQKRKEELKKSVEEELKRVRKIKCYTSSGEFLRTCDYVKEASRIYNVPDSSIYNQFNGKSLVTNGFIFIDCTETIDERLKKIRKRKTHKKNL